MSCPRTRFKPPIRRERSAREQVRLRRLHRVLLGLGFTYYDTATLTSVYKQDPSGAAVYLTWKPSGRYVRPHQALSAKLTLNDFGVLPSEQFEVRMKQAES